MNNTTMNSRKNASRMERQQRKLDAGFVSQFPEVARIVINMMYKQTGIRESLPRVVNFFPGSCALFRIDCLSKECVSGGFDLTQVITGMIKNHKAAAKGILSCEGDGSPADHSNIAYEVAIQYM